MTAPDVPVLLMAWRRPDVTRLVLDRIRLAQPRRLFVSLDGPRPGDEAAVGAVAELIEATVDWSCELRVRRQDTNLGCRAAVSGALDWFFEEVDRGIILEDDTVPDPTFFPYCAELLDRYRTDEDIWMISGVNLLGRWRPERGSYFFGHGGIWGWATWRRAWAHADIGMSRWPDAERRDAAMHFLGSRDWNLNEAAFRGTAAGEIDTWDYPWSFSRAAGGGLSVIPSTNLVHNAGFGPDATHTSSTKHPFARLEAQPMAFPLHHPSGREFDRAYQRAVARVEHPSTARRVARRSRSLLRQWPSR